MILPAVFPMIASQVRLHRSGKKNRFTTYLDYLNGYFKF